MAGLSALRVASVVVGSGLEEALQFLFGDQLGRRELGNEGVQALVCDAAALALSAGFADAEADRTAKHRVRLAETGLSLLMIGFGFAVQCGGSPAISPAR